MGNLQNIHTCVIHAESLIHSLFEKKKNKTMHYPINDAFTKKHFLHIHLEGQIASTLQ